jgi:lipoic acid synthetase
VIRTKAKYEKSLDVIRYISGKGKIAKSGFMLGLGEKETEVFQAIQDLYKNGCKILTIGQYLQPGSEYMEVVEYISPEKFAEYRIMSLELGFSFVESAPLVRSSLHAEKHITAG